MHDISEVLRAEADRLPDAVRSELEALTGAFRQLRRDRDVGHVITRPRLPQDRSGLA